MNLVRKVIESTYDGTCTVTEHVEYEKENSSTGFKDEIVLINEPCRLSFSSSQTAQQGEQAAAITQSIKLFIRPELTIKPGSKITVTQNGVTADYTRSGVPAVYPTHQEIALELWKRWS